MQCSVQIKQNKGGTFLYIFLNQSPLKAETCNAYFSVFSKFAVIVKWYISYLIFKKLPSPMRLNEVPWNLNQGHDTMKIRRQRGWFCSFLLLFFFQYALGIVLRSYSCSVCDTILVPPESLHVLASAVSSTAAQESKSERRSDYEIRQNSKGVDKNGQKMIYTNIQQNRGKA